VRLTVIVPTLPNGSLDRTARAAEGNVTKSRYDGQLRGARGFGDARGRDHGSTGWSQASLRSRSPERLALHYLRRDLTIG
jgi:hypothetical protein